MTLRNFGESFLGRCVARPFRRDAKNDFANEGGAKLVAAAVAQILGTVGDTGFTSGELPWRTDFGSALELLRHKNADTVFNHLARVYVVGALQRWEPRVIVTKTEVITEYIDGEAHNKLLVMYDIASSSTPGSAVVARSLIAETYLS